MPCSDHLGQQTFRRHGAPANYSGALSERVQDVSDVARQYVAVGTARHLVLVDQAAAVRHAGLKQDGGLAHPLMNCLLIDYAIAREYQQEYPESGKVAVQRPLSRGPECRKRRHRSNGMIATY